MVDIPGSNLIQGDTAKNAIIGGALGSIAGVPMLGGMLGGTIGKVFGKKKKKDTSAEDAYYAYKNRYNNASNDLTNTKNETLYGGDNTDLLDYYKNFLNDFYKSNPNSFHYYGADDIMNRFVNDETKNRKNSLQNWLNNSFAGYGTTNDYLNNFWTNDSDKDFNQNFLQGYYDDALSQLDTAKNRGLLNEAGYNSAISSLDRRHSAAQGAINELTDPVLQGYRDDLANTVGGFQSAIDNYSLGQRNIYNADQFANQYNTLYGQQQGSLEGDLNSSVADYTPFIVADILGDARNTQGILTGGEENPELLQSLQDQKKNQQNKVGLGNQGVF